MRRLDLEKENHHVTIIDIKSKISLRLIIPTQIKDQLSTKVASPIFLHFKQTITKQIIGNREQNAINYGVTEDTELDLRVVLKFTL